MLKLENSLTPLLVVAVALVAGDRQVLLHRRPLGTVHGGLWEFPGGKVEKGESPENAALRELDEELGVVLDATRLVPVGFASGLTAGAEEGGSDQRRTLVILLYAAFGWSGEPQARDGADIAWLRPEEISGLAMPPLDYPLAAALQSHLGSYS